MRSHRTVCCVVQNSPAVASAPLLVPPEPEPMPPAPVPAPPETMPGAPATPVLPAALQTASHAPAGATVQLAQVSASRLSVQRFAKSVLTFLPAPQLGPKVWPPL